MSETKELNIYETTDIGLSAYLKSNGVNYLGDRKDGKKIIFQFEKEIAIKKAKDFNGSQEYKFYTEIRIMKMIVRDLNGNFR